MKMKNIIKNKKGFAFTLDALAATFLISLMFALLLLHSSKSDNFLEKLYLSKESGDTIMLLKNNGVLDSLNSTTIMEGMENISTKSQMKINLTYADTALQQKTSRVYGEEPDENDFVVFGKRFFVTKNSTDLTSFAVVKYNSWRAA